MEILNSYREDRKKIEKCIKNNGRYRSYLRDLNSEYNLHVLDKKDLVICRKILQTQKLITRSVNLYCTYLKTNFKNNYAVVFTQVCKFFLVILSDRLLWHEFSIFIFKSYFILVMQCLNKLQILRTKVRDI